MGHPEFHQDRCLSMKLGGEVCLQAFQTLLQRCLMRFMKESTLDKSSKQRKFE